MVQSKDQVLNPQNGDQVLPVQIDERNVAQILAARIRRRAGAEIDPDVVLVDQSPSAFGDTRSTHLGDDFFQVGGS